MADKDFLVKNGIVVNTAFTANSSQFALGNTVVVNTSTISVGGATVNSTIYTGTANNANNLAGHGVMTDATSYWGNTAGIIMTTDKTVAADVYQTITDASSPVINCAAGINFKWTLGASRTLPNMTSIIEGRSGIFKIKEDGTGGWTFSFGNCYVFDGMSAPTINTTANATTLLCWHAISTSNVLITMPAKGITGV